AGAVREAARLTLPRVRSRVISGTLPPRHRRGGAARRKRPILFSSICAPGQACKLLQLVVRKIQFSRRHIFLQVSNRGCPWDQKDVWSAVEQPTQCHLCRRRSEVFANIGESSFGGSKRRPLLHRVGSQRAIRHERNAFA